MENRDNSGIPPDDGQFDYSKKKNKGEVDCDVENEGFPYVGRCYESVNTVFGIVYKSKCPKCRVWASLPDCECLTVATIFECCRYGYGRRINE